MDYGVPEVRGHVLGVVRELAERYDIDGLDLRPTFDGHANCYIESGFGKGILIDFNYEVEPLPGKYPLPGIGPFSLLQESRMNLWGKVLFSWL
jgi:sulfide:quinone oxidoreductase